MGWRAPPRVYNRAVEALPQRRKTGWRTPVSVALVIAAAVLPGLGGVDFPFLHDDRWAVVENPRVVGDIDLAGILSSNAWGDAPDHRHIPNYRPLSVLTLAATHAAAGLDPRPYRATNLILHALASLALLGLAGALGARLLPATAAAAWFAAHPVHAEAVFFAVNREELLCATFVLAALALATRRFLTEGAPTAPRPSLRIAAGAFWAAALTALALLSKEAGATLPLLLGVLIFALAPRHQPRGSGVLFVAASAMALFGYLALRHWALGRWMAAHIPWQDNPLVLAGTAERMTSALALVWKALALLVAPARLTIDYGFDATGLPAAGFPPESWLGLATVAAVVALFAWTRRRAPAIALGLALLALPYALVSNLFFPNSILFAERLLYLPSAGAALALAGLLDLAWTRLGGRAPLLARMPVVLILAVAVAFGAMLASRNSDYRSGRALFDASLAAYPRSTRLWNNLAIELQNDGEWERSAQALERALAIDPTNAEAHNNLGLAQARGGQLREAARSFGQALDLRPGMAAALGNLCMLLETQPDEPRALAVCEMAVHRGAPVRDVVERLRNRAGQTGAHD